MGSFQRKLKRAKRREIVMQVDVTQLIKGFDGRDIPGTDEDGSKAPVTLKKAITNALMSTFDDEKTLAGDKKLTRHKLAMKVHNCEGEMKFSAEDLSLIKELVAKAYATIVSGPVWELLSEESKPVLVEDK